MKELLKRWSELEPERCRYNADGSHYNEAPHFWLTMNDQDGTCDSIDVLDIDWEQPGALGIIQGYVQQAIEARGFTANLKMGIRKFVAEIIEPNLTVTVIDTANFMPKQKWGSVSNDSLVHALLSAYIQALESELTATLETTRENP